MSEIIKSIAPLGMDELKRVFGSEDVIFEFDMLEQDGSMAGKALLIYCSNIGMQTRITNVTHEQLRDYMMLQAINNDLDLPHLHANVLFVAKTGSMLYESPDYSLDYYWEFIENNSDLVAQQMQFIDSMLLYLCYIYGEDEQDIIKRATGVDTTTHSEIGLNIVKLFELDEFLIEWFGQTAPTQEVFFEVYFKEYMFQGKNLFNYFATANNGLFTLAATLKQEGMVATSE